MANCYQCYECGSTLYADALSSDDNGYSYVTSGELCSSCEEKNNLDCGCEGKEESECMCGYYD